MRVNKGMKKPLSYADVTPFRGVYAQAGLAIPTRGFFPRSVEDTSREKTTRTSIVVFVESSEGHARVTLKTAHEKPLAPGVDWQWRETNWMNQTTLTLTLTQAMLKAVQTALVQRTKEKNVSKISPLQ